MKALINPPCVTLVWAVLAATAPSCATAEPPPPACVAKVNAAALRAMGQTALGQTQIWGDPVDIGPHHLRVDAKVFGGGDYYVDVMIDPHCDVRSVSTTLELNGPP